MMIGIIVKMMIGIIVEGQLSSMQILLDVLYTYDPFLTQETHYTPRNPLRLQHTILVRLIAIHLGLRESL